MTLNPFDQHRDRKRWTVAELILSGRTVSWTDIREAVGKMSPRTMGFVLRALEDRELTILRLRDPEHGTLYKYEAALPFDPAYRVSKQSGYDAERQRAIKQEA